MKAKVTFLAGMATGYVLGAKAGTQRYEELKHVAAKLWRSEPVQGSVSVVEDTLGKDAAKTSKKVKAKVARGLRRRAKKARR
ncbi:hypothetical protein CVV68_16855 [Arthrobacter livingstonensis]|uniref:YtxH domain-containing protein n=1 Tax=Arthrobacter livingstonensis TaxID=670078 RepID=A0A2V5L696_9MICC|nr:hypothetical protein [Arthrobacter livingstonensis]PYI65714.1 hypothetical protein CVV68_16855 [Arthrobacter livingstonensis]